MRKHLLTLVLLAGCYSASAQVSCEQLFDSFKQGERPNCASIALIKAGLNVYGLDSLFRAESSAGNTTRIVLKDGSTLSLTAAELEQARTSAAFVSLNPSAENIRLINYAVLAYAVMAKNKQLLDEEPDFATALSFLEDGAYTPTIYKYLGFRKGKQIKGLRRLAGGNYQGVVAWSPAHAVFACEGYMDYHGSRKPLWFRYSGRFMVVRKPV